VQVIDWQDSLVDGDVESYSLTGTHCSVWQEWNEWWRTTLSFIAYSEFKSCPYAGLHNEGESQNL